MRANFNLIVILIHLQLIRLLNSNMLELDYHLFPIIQNLNSYLIIIDLFYIILNYFIL